MPLTLDKVHEYQRIPGTLEVRLIKTQPYVRITSGGQPPIIIQGGVLYSEGGQVVTAIPDWFTEEVAKLSPLVRAEVGLKDDAPEAEPQPKQKPKPPKAGTWTCPAEGCGKTMPSRGRRFHELHHRKRMEREHPGTTGDPRLEREERGGDTNG